MTAAQAIEIYILNELRANEALDWPKITMENAEEFEAELVESGLIEELFDTSDAFRCSGEPTDLPVRQAQRRLDCTVAQVLPGLQEGLAVAWTDSGDDLSHEWWKRAYYVRVREETHVVNVYEALDSAD